MRLHSITTLAALAALSGLAFAVPAEACPMQQQNVENNSPVRIAADMDRDAVKQSPRPDANDQTGAVENKADQKDVTPDTAPAAE